MPFADDMAHNGFPLLEALGPGGSCADVALLPCGMGLCPFGLLQLALLTLPADLLRLPLDVGV